jgi:hypothetical protein
VRLAVLCNGPSLASHDLSRIKIPVMGLNRSHAVYPSPDYHVTLDGDHYRQTPKWYEAIAKLGKLYVAGECWTIGKVLPIRKDCEFSTDLKLGVVTELGGVGSVFYAALQVAYGLGYREVYALGLDLGGGVHFDGTPCSPHVERQNELFRHLPSDLTVRVVGSPESRANLPRMTFAEMLEAQ